MECIKVRAPRGLYVPEYIKRIKQRATPSARRNLAAAARRIKFWFPLHAHTKQDILLYILSKERAHAHIQHPGIEKGKPLFLRFLITRCDTMRSRKHTGAFFVLFYIHIRTLQSIGDKKFPQATGSKVIKCTHIMLAIL